MRVLVDNLITEYQDEGSGPIILLLHGWGDNLRTFDALVPHLSSTRRIIRLDLPSFGKSEAPGKPWSLDDYVQFVADFIKKIDVSVDVLVGHSFGGRVAIKGISTNKLSARKIILMGSAGIARRRTFRNTAFAVLAKIGKILVLVPPLFFWRQELRRALYSFAGSDYVSSGALKETFLRVIAEDLGPSAEQIAVPTLLIWGANDTETPLSDGKRLSHMICNSRLEVIEGAGHFVHRDHPEKVARLMRELYE